MSNFSNNADLSLCLAGAAGADRQACDCGGQDGKDLVNWMLMAFVVLTALGLGYILLAMIVKILQLLFLLAVVYVIVRS
jgi:hypothetical protein